MGDNAVVPFDELPRLPGSGLRHSWDLNGPGDQLGTLNRLTGPVVAAAAAAVRTGERIGVSLPLEQPDPPFFGREALRHTVFATGPGALDDKVDGFYLQCSSQWDGLRHIGSPDGWLAAGMADVRGYTAAGLSGGESMARFLWDSGVAAVACDNPAVEVVPGDPAVGFLHGRLIPCLGFAIGELFDFGRLAAACARSGRYEFMFASVPLNLTGAVGSPANAVAIL